MTTAAPPFPFSAVVGHDDVKTALILNAVDRRLGGVVLRGEKGSAKSTLARALAGLLPEGGRLVDLPLSATEDRVVGALDLESALTTGKRRFQPGLLAEADNGVLYVDEINLLPDHLVDVLLDVAASGTNRVERDGVAESHPSRFVLVGSMNPEEGELRPQLLDRFGLAVDVASSHDPPTRAEAVRRRLAYDHDPVSFVAGWADDEAELARRLAAAVPAELPPELLEVVSELCVAVDAEGLRADLVLCRAAAALAGWEGRTVTTVAEVRRVATMALGHRRRRSPFDEPGIDPGEIERALDHAARNASASPARDGRRRGPCGAGEEPSGAGDEPSGSGEELHGAGEGPQGAGGSATHPPASDRVAPPDEPTRVVALRAPRAVADSAGGRRSVVEGRRGRMVGDRPPDGPLSDLAVAATIRAAAARQSGPAAQRRDRSAQTGGISLERSDLRQAVRQQRAGNLLVLVVDASASMGVARRMEAVKGAVLGLLLDAYQRRDRVALVTFRGDGAEVVLRPTGSVEVARSRLDQLATGGRTPLAAGIERAIEVAGTAAQGHRPLLVLVSDGRATAAPRGVEPLGAALAAAAKVRQRGLPSVIVDVEDGPTRLGLARRLAEAMGARHLPLPELSAAALASAIRAAMPSTDGGP